MVPSLRRIVEDCRARPLWRRDAYDSLERFAGQGGILHERVDLLHIGAFMGAVMEGDSLRTDKRLKGVRWIGKIREFYCHRSLRRSDRLYLCVGPNGKT